MAVVRVNCICWRLWLHICGIHDIGGGKPTGMVDGGEDGGTHSHILLSRWGLRCAQETHGNLRHQVRSNVQRQISEGRRHDEDEDEARRSRSRSSGERWGCCEQQIEAICASDGYRYAEPCGPLAVSALLSAQPIAVVAFICDGEQQEEEG